MKIVIILILFVGMMMVLHGIYNEKLTDAKNNVKIEYRFLPRTLYEEQLGKKDPALSKLYSNMFQEDSPWQ